MKRVVLTTAWQLAAITCVWKLFTLNPDRYSHTSLVTVALLFATLMMANIYSLEDK